MAGRLKMENSSACPPVFWQTDRPLEPKRYLHFAFGSVRLPRKAQYNLLSAIAAEWENKKNKKYPPKFKSSPVTESRIQVPFCSSSADSFSKRIRQSYEPWSSSCRASSRRDAVRTRDTRPVGGDSSLKGGDRMQHLWHACSRWAVK